MSASDLARGSLMAQMFDAGNSGSGEDGGWERDSERLQRILLEVEVAADAELADALWESLRITPAVHRRFTDHLHRTSSGATGGCLEAVVA